MRAVSKNIYSLIKQLQALPAMTGGILVGGTNLALRYGHRISHDIDLFFPASLGKSGFETIKQEIQDNQETQLIAGEFPLDLDDLRIWLRCFMRQSSETIKVDLIQNVTFLDQPEIIDGISLATERDIGLMKLMTACNRAAKKDIYDLDYLTDRISLPKLMVDLQQKLSLIASRPKTVFELDYNANPIDHPQLLLRFELPQESSGRLWHGNEHLDPVQGEKNWMSARSSWRLKVRSYFREIGIDFPTDDELRRVEQQLIQETAEKNREEDNDEDISQGYTR